MLRPVQLKQLEKAIWKSISHIENVNHNENQTVVKHLSDAHKERFEKDFHSMTSRELMEFLFCSGMGYPFYSTPNKNPATVILKDGLGTENI